MHFAPAEEVHEERSLLVQICQKQFTLRAVSLGILMHIIRQMTGYDTISFYTITIYYIAGESSSAGASLMVVLLSIRLLANLLAFANVDK